MLNSVTDTIGNSFIITTETGEIIVIDGGFKSETDYFLSYLKEVTGEEKPHIDAWFISHPHADHAEVFMEITENRPDAVTFDKVYANFPSALSLKAVDDSAANTAAEFYRLLPLFAEKYTVVSGGDDFNIGSARIRVLSSPDYEFKSCNDQTVAFRMDLGGRSVLFLGDCGVPSGKKMLRIWENSGVLDCDICQMAHHGQDGVDYDLYEAVKPEICLWCTPSWLWTNDGGKGPYKTLEVRDWMEKIGVRQNIVKFEGTRKLEL